MTGLSRMLQCDLSEASDEELISGIQQAETVYSAAPMWSGRLLAALHRSGKSWPEISRLTGVSQTTAFRRAKDFL